jgi:periplasmic protein TonB
VRGIRLRGFSFFAASSDSWLGRVWENFRQVFTPTKLSPTSANGAPIHLFKLDRSQRAERAQTLSFIAHVGIIAGILAIASYPPQLKREPPRTGISIGRLLYSAPKDQFASSPSLGRKAGGGENSASPATHGFFAPRSSVQLVPPRLPDQASHLLPVTTTILDLQAPQVVSPENNLGLPWMPTSTNSAGTGSDGGIGKGKDGGMGDREGPRGGEGESDLAYTNGVSLPTCVICPNPVYTDQARHVKMQGTVTLRVLVGTDGKAADIRVVRGIGYGLEERAVQTVRGWKFNPARDANRRAVAAWVTVETVFRLF